MVSRSLGPFRFCWVAKGSFHNYGLELRWSELSGPTYTGFELRKAQRWSCNIKSSNPGDAWHPVSNCQWMKRAVATVINGGDTKPHLLWHSQFESPATIVRDDTVHSTAAMMKTLTSLIQDVSSTVADLIVPSSVATVWTGVFANLSNKIANITGKFENVGEAKNWGV